MLIYSNGIMYHGLLELSKHSHSSSHSKNLSQIDIFTLLRSGYGLKYVNTRTVLLTLPST